MQNATAPTLEARWITVPGRAKNSSDWLVSAIPSLAVIADTCLTLDQLNTHIPGLRELVEQWPKIVRALVWKVNVNDIPLDAERREYLPAGYADKWQNIPWRTLTVRCEKATGRGIRPINVIHSRTSGLSAALIGPEGLFTKTRRQTLAPLLADVVEESEDARFPSRIEVSAELGDVQLETYAITNSPYRPEEQAARFRGVMRDSANPDGEQEQLGRSMLEAASRAGELTDSVLSYVNQTYFGRRLTAAREPAPDAVTAPYKEYFLRTSLECDPWPQTTQNLNDFQEYWNGLLGYPALAREYGITNDLKITDAAQYLIEAARLSIRVTATLPSTALPTLSASARILINGAFKSPNTIGKVIAFDGGRFVVVPAPRSDSDLSGLLSLKTCELVSMNLDDAAWKTRTTAESEASKDHSTVTAAASNRNMPTLSTWGLALLHPSEKRLLVEPPRRPSSEVEELNAEHLTAGHRFDVSLNASEWTSLCSRTVKYESQDLPTHIIHCLSGGAPAPTTSAPASTTLTPDAQALRVFEEGIVRTAGAKKQTRNGSAHLVSDELFVWQDWPICVPESDDQVATHPHLPFLQTVSYCPQHDVRLRFGKRYQVRGRLAFLNGDGLTVEEATAYRNKIGATDLDAHGSFERMEPLRPPEVHVAKCIEEDTPGDQLDVVIVRSGPDIRSSQRHSERYVVPPRVQAQFANFHHDAFDLHDSDTAQPDGSLKRVFLTCSGDVPSVQEVKDKFGNKYVANSPSQQHKNDTMVVFDDKYASEVGDEYYVDPMARYVHAGLVRSSNSCWADRLPSLEVIEKGDWPTAKIFRLEVDADTQLVEHCIAKWTGALGGIFSPCRDVLNVRLAPAEHLVLKLWSGTDRAGSVRMNSYRSAAQILAGTTEKPPPVSERALGVSIPFANPAREVVLIHATQKPLQVPGFDPKTVSIGRQYLGDAGAAFEGYALCHRPSTGTLECFASWREFVDDVNSPGPRWIERRETARVIPPIILKPAGGFTDRVAFDVDDDGNKRALRHQIGSTSHRTVEYWLEAVSAFAEYFPSTTLCRTTSEDAVREKKTLTVQVRASVAPEPPILSAIVPLFTHQEDHHSSDKVTRTVTGFRVRLARPFFTRGHGQRLAVVCWPLGTFATGAPYRPRANAIGSQVRPAAEIPKSLEPYISRIGQDPMWPGAAPFELLPPEFFVGGELGQEAIAFPGVYETDPQDPNETPTIKRVEGTVSFVSFPVAPESLNQDLMEYSCDIGIDLTAVSRRPEDLPYFPYLRMAFAAHQANAIDGATLSPVVVADLIQVHPNRQAQVIYQSRSARARLLVSGFGRPEFLAAQDIDESLDRLAPAFEVRARLFWRSAPNAPLEQVGPVRPLSIGRDPEGYQAVWDLPRPSSQRGGTWELFVEEVWIVPCDPKRDQADCVVRPRKGKGDPFSVVEYPKLLLRLPLLNW